MRDIKAVYEGGNRIDKGLEGKRNARGRIGKDRVKLYSYLICV